VDGGGTRAQRATTSSTAERQTGEKERGGGTSVRTGELTARRRDWDGWRCWRGQTSGAPAPPGRAQPRRVQHAAPAAHRTRRPRTAARDRQIGLPVVSRRPDETSSVALRQPDVGQWACARPERFPVRSIYPAFGSRGRLRCGTVNTIRDTRSLRHVSLSPRHHRDVQHRQTSSLTITSGWAGGLAAAPCKGQPGAWLSCYALFLPYAPWSAPHPSTILPARRFPPAVAKETAFTVPDHRRLQHGRPQISHSRSTSLQEPLAETLMSGSAAVVCPSRSHGR